MDRGVDDEEAAVGEEKGGVDNILDDEGVDDYDHDHDHDDDHDNDHDDDDDDDDSNKNSVVLN